MYLHLHLLKSGYFIITNGLSNFTYLCICIDKLYSSVFARLTKGVDV